MTTEHRNTREEEAYERLLDEIWVLSEPARALINEAQWAAYRANMMHHYPYRANMMHHDPFQPGEDEEAMQKMRRAAAGLSDRECELLAKLWLAALAAAASIDPSDKSLVGYKVDGRNLHWYYRMISDMVELMLLERRTAEHNKEIAERGPVDLLDIPF